MIGQDPWGCKSIKGVVQVSKEEWKEKLIIDARNAIGISKKLTGVELSGFERIADLFKESQYTMCVAK